MRFLKDSIIVSLKQAIEASHLIERFIWICLGTLGSVYFGYLLVSQVNSWDENSILVSQQQKSIDEIDFPAITFCARTSTRYGIAERIGNTLDLTSDFAKKQFLPLRNDFIKRGEEREWSESKELYEEQCVDEFSKMETDDEIERFCTVRNTVFFKTFSLKVQLQPWTEVI